ncbi:Dps family protein [Caviibacter abscessus]|uniref:Dps family protein n=1 Tax=Caviibacter abscessus TaxID=1766719 RepID=UPI000837AA52|nr:DNA starvation/stationary phase protection protein [Caviibacter abscessus]
MEKRLNQFLADLTVLSKKVQNYHWNIKGHGFFSIHVKLDEIYEQLNEEIDVIAERILALGNRPLSSLKEYLEIANIKEATSTEIDIDSALNSLKEDVSYIISSAKEIKVLADEKNDYGTSSIIDNFIVEYEKLNWMLRVAR